MLREYVDMKEEQADRDIRLITRCGPAPERVRIQGRNVHRRGQSSEDPCQKAPSRVSKNFNFTFKYSCNCHFKFLYFHITLTMALEAESDQSVNKNYKYRFSDKAFSYLKQASL